MYQLMKRDWELRNSSLFTEQIPALKREIQILTYKECREYACKDISQKTWNSFNDIEKVIEIPKGKEFHFLGRVDTDFGGDYRSEEYYEVFRRRKYVAFSTINNRNVSHFHGKPFLIYNMLPKEIVHVFPADSDTEQYAENEEELTFLPSFWLKLNELEELTNLLGVYNQITCETKRDGEIIKPYAVVAFGEIDEKISEIAKNFNIKCILVHPDENAINYSDDLLLDKKKITSISPIMEKKYGIKLKNMAHI